MKEAVERNKIPEKPEIEEALINLEKMYQGWGLKSKDWVIVDEMAYVLQGYPVIGEEMKTRHLDTYVDGNKLPWTPKAERSTIPPINSQYMNQYSEFMQRTGFGLDMLVAVPGVLEEKSVNYQLPYRRKVRLMEARAMTRQFFKQTLMRYSIKDVGPEKIKEWVDKLGLIRKAAFHREDTQLADDCQKMLAKARKKWISVL